MNNPGGFAFYPPRRIRPSDISDSYKFSTGKNRLREGDPFAEHFGRVRIYPALLQNTYDVWKRGVSSWSNYLYFAGIVGVGEYDIEQVYIGDTPIEDFIGSEYAITGPNEIDANTNHLPHTPELAWICKEIEGVSLLDRDENKGFILNPSYTKIGMFTINLEFPEGNSGGTLDIYCVEVDDYGEETTGNYFWDSYTLPTSSDPFSSSVSYALVGAYAYTGASQARVKLYIFDCYKNIKITSVVGIGAFHDDYGDCTILSCKLKATDILNGEVASKINVIATRKLGIVSGSGIGSTLTATRSIVDAVAHLITAENCGNQNTNIIDFAALNTLRSTLEAYEYYFDHSFVSRVSVMEAVKIAAACGKCIAYMDGGLFSMKQDAIQSSPTCLFTDDNIKELKMKVNPYSEDQFTSVDVSYHNGTTWKDENSLCYDEESTSPEYNPKEITLYGCSERQQAYEIGMYLYWRLWKERTEIEFTADMIGHIPQIFDKVLIPNRMGNFGSCGLIISVEETTIKLSEPVDFDGEEEGFIYISLEDGTVGGPYTVEPTDYAHIVTGTISNINTLSENGLKASRFLFGTGTPLFMRIESINPDGRDMVKILGTIIDDDVYSDPGTAPAIGEPPGTSALLLTVNLQYNGDDGDDHQFELSWDGNAAKVKIELDEGSGYSTLADDYTDKTYEFDSDVDSITVKITPYDGAVLETDSAIEIEWAYAGDTNTINVTFPSLTNISTVRSVAFTSDSDSIVEWGSGQEQTGVLTYTANDPPTGDDDYTIRDHNKIVLNSTKWQDSIEANVLGLLNVDTRQG